MTRLRPILASVLTALLALTVTVLTAAPASAHSVSGQSATNVKSRIDSISPSVTGLTVKVVELGSRIELTWTGADQLVVQGYSGEPYLRIGPDGIFRNRRSPATYVNQTRTGVAIPADATVDANAAPDWVRIGSGRTVLWHDHRVHLMGNVLPPQVTRAPGQPHLMQRWTIPLNEGGRTITVAGQYDWVPPASSWPWVALIVGLAALGVVAGLTRVWAPALMALTALIITADVVHAVGIGMASVGSFGHRVGVILGGSYYSVVAWVLGAVAIRLLARRSVDGLFAAVFSALVVGLFGGLTDVAWLGRSQVPFGFGSGLARLLVAVSIGGAAGLIPGSILAFRRNRVPPAPVDEPELGSAIAGRHATA